MILTFRHPDMPPANNGKDGLIRMHFRKKKDWITKLGWLMAEQKVDRIRNPCTCTITNYCIIKMDWDNLASRCKLLFDSMKKNGYIKDDSPNYIVDLKMKQIRVKTKKEVKVEFLFDEITES